ncbi:diacylglycerol kinase family protein [Frigoribacterium sp. CFBP 13712]|uniref:diacylglycerol/lipid kinase family protein n=1 Tax=Frigoribacterium sp. CFBP 13712 TaxID=2775309 RepID=UPI00177C272C|nr:YegS/Rv2252/BmrU family lipid kinase [Frigoribacterium sp. CFBP 13712]MBD8704820.1 YegS/Rv2252/BmrU family lipid kinase [Frigoribacterium sp. CFBP 13712]
MSPTPLRLVVAVNPSASFGRRSDVGSSVVSALTRAGHDVTVLLEQSFDDLVVAARTQLATSPDALIVVGGDGMMNLGTNLVAGTDVPLGLVPTGTGNDMARALGIPHDDSDAATRLLVSQLDRPARVIDAGRVSRGTDTTWFACMLSAGFDAVVNERANRMRRPRGRSRYNLALYLELIRLQHLSYRLEIDGESMQLDGTLVSVGNGRSFGGGITVLPDAELDDGLLDVLVVERLGRLQFLRLFGQVARGTHLADPRVHVHRARRVTIHSDDVAAYADGERIGSLPVTVEVVPGALRVLAPAAV